MIAGHTRCLVDGCFGLLKKTYCRSDLLTELADAVNLSAQCYAAQPEKNDLFSDKNSTLLERERERERERKRKREREREQFA